MSGVGRTEMNNINSLRRSLRMSQAEFAEHCDSPFAASFSVFPGLKDGTYVSGISTASRV